MTEAELRAEVVRLAHASGWLVFSLPAAKTRRPVKDAVGYPDLTLARLGRVVFVELKAQDGICSDAQMRWLRALPGMYVWRPLDMDEIKGVLT